jgi:hypothetical protein
LFNTKSYTLVTPPASEPVALADVKTFLRIDVSNDDAILNMLISSCRRMAEEYCQRAFITQSWRLVMDRFTDGEIQLLPGFYTAPTPFEIDGYQDIQLSRLPIQSITHIKTTNDANVQSTVSAAIYALDTDNGRVLLNEGRSWPTELRDRASVEVEFVAGYGSASNVPEPIKQGILQHVAASYTNKVCADIPAGSMSLYGPFRTVEAFGGF